MPPEISVAKSVQDISEMIHLQFIVQQPDSSRKKNQAEDRPQYFAQPMIHSA
jgi:hypothetical protein